MTLVGLLGEGLDEIAVSKHGPFAAFLRRLMGGGGGGGGGGTPTTFDYVFSPGNPTPAGNQYTSWSALVAAANAAGGHPLVTFDSSFGPIVIPSSASFTNDPLWRGDPQLAENGAPTSVSFAPGVAIRGVTSFRDLGLVGGATPVFTASPGNVTYTFDGFSSVSAPGAAPLFQKTTPGVLTVYVNDFSEFVPSASPIVDVTVAGVSFLAVTNASGIIGANTIRGVAGSVYGGRIGDAQGIISLPQLTPAFPVAFGAESIFIQYVPANVANWSGIAPSSVSNALDRIAAKITPILLRQLGYGRDTRKSYVRVGAPGAPGPYVKATGPYVCISCVRGRSPGAVAAPGVTRTSLKPFAPSTYVGKGTEMPTVPLNVKGWDARAPGSLARRTLDRSSAPPAETVTSSGEKVLRRRSQSMLVRIWTVFGRRIGRMVLPWAENTARFVTATGPVRRMPPVMNASLAVNR